VILQPVCNQATMDDEKWLLLKENWIVKRLIGILVLLETESGLRAQLKMDMLMLQVCL
jgi:hypothetical protein